MDTENSIAAFYVTSKGSRLARKIRGLFPELVTEKFSKRGVQNAWNQGKTLIFIMAAGIVVRSLAALIKDKRSDPAVIVIDEAGRYAISLLSGHLGGANEKAREIARFLNGQAVITTASEVTGVTSIDLWARDRGLVIDDWKRLPGVGTRLLNTGFLKVYADVEIDLPDDFVRESDPAKAHALVTNRKYRAPKSAVYLRPRNLVVGIGCNSGTPSREIEETVHAVVDEHNLSFLSVGALATIDRKGEEQGLKLFASKYSFPLLCYGADELNRVTGIATSQAAFKATGAKAVAEPAALLGAGTEELLVPKQKRGNVTVAVAQTRAPIVIEERKAGGMATEKAGRIYVVGIGPGALEHLTPCAERAIRASDIIVGYRTYVNLIRDVIGDKVVSVTGMTQEVERCTRAIDLALTGKTVAVISGGDPGIYGMAGLVFELLRKRDTGLPLPCVEVIPGITALSACAARLGAPIMHDFASISLSDRLTPWTLIEKRLDAAALADLVIILYNPRSKGRAGHITRAREIILRHRPAETPVGTVKGAMRDDERITLTTLGAMPIHDMDMETTVIIGNSETYTWQNRMITPRGYERIEEPFNP
jgi:cobalt-precorrin 5A hydrolase / precorrin-3B C17-methyltransferase